MGPVEHGEIAGTHRRSLITAGSGVRPRVGLVRAPRVLPSARYAPTLSKDRLEDAYALLTSSQLSNLTLANLRSCRGQQFADLRARRGSGTRMRTGFVVVTPYLRTVKTRSSTPTGADRQAHLEAGQSPCAG